MFKFWNILILVVVTLFKVQTGHAVNGANACMQLFGSNELSLGNFSFANKYLQIELWELEKTNSSLAATYKAAIEKELATGEVISKKLYDGDPSYRGKSSAQSEIWTYRSGLKAIYKRSLPFERIFPSVRRLLGTFNNPVNEIAAYKFDQIIGFDIVPIAVDRIDLNHGSIQLWVDKRFIAFKDEVNVHEKIKTIVFDFLIDNWDRSFPKEDTEWAKRTFRNNVEFEGVTGKVVAFDNGAAFDLIRWKKYWGPKRLEDGTLEHRLRHEIEFDKIKYDIPKDIQDMVLAIDTTIVVKEFPPYLRRSSLQAFVLKIENLKEFFREQQRLKATPSQ